jgi:hypothetical protein
MLLPIRALPKDATKDQQNSVGSLSIGVNSQRWWLDGHPVLSFQQLALLHVVNYKP